MGIRNPDLLKAKSKTIKEALPALVEVLQDTDKALELVIRNPNLLTAKSKTIKEALPALVEVFGNKDKALKIVGRSPSLLKTRKVTITSAMTWLIKNLGREGAQKIVTMQSNLLRISTAKMESRFQLITATKLNAQATVLRRPLLLNMSEQ